MKPMEQSTQRIRPKLLGVILTVFGLMLIVGVEYAVSLAVDRSSAIPFLIRVSGSLILLAVTIIGLFIPRFRSLAIGGIIVWIILGTLALLVFSKVLLTGSLM